MFICRKISSDLFFQVISLKLVLTCLRLRNTCFQMSMALIGKGRQIGLFVARAISRPMASPGPKLQLLPKFTAPSFAMTQRSMFIQTQETPNPQSLKFLPGTKVRKICRLATEYVFYIFSNFTPSYSWSFSHQRADLLLDWRLATKWPQLLTTYLFAAYPTHRSMCWISLLDHLKNLLMNLLFNLIRVTLDEVGTVGLNCC